MRIFLLGGMFLSLLGGLNLGLATDLPNPFIGSSSLSYVGDMEGEEPGCFGECEVFWSIG